MKNYRLRLWAFALLTFAGGSAYSQVEQVTNLTVSNPAAVVSTLGQYLQTGDAMADSVTLLQVVLGGDGATTHTIVAIFDDMETLEKSLNTRSMSEAWGNTQRSLSAVAAVNSSALAIQRKTWGKNAWSEGEYLAAVEVVSPDGQKWIAAADEWLRTSKVRNPGMQRIVRLRGAPSSHAFLIVASTYSDLINYMEAVEGSAEFATMRAATPTRPISTTYYRIAKVWNP